VRNMKHKVTCNYDRNRQYSQSNNRHERGSFSSGKRRRDIQDGTMQIPSNDNRRILNPDFNVYAPKTAADEVNLNAIAISPVI